MKNHILSSLKYSLIKLVNEFKNFEIFKVGTNFAENEAQFKSIVKINILSYVLILIFLIFFFRAVFLWHLDCLLYLFVIIKIFFVLRSKLRFNKLVVLWFFIEVSVIIFYYSSFGGVLTLTIIFYFPMLFSLLFFYDFKKDGKYIFVVFIFIIVELFILGSSNFSLFLYPHIDNENPILLSLIILCNAIFVIYFFMLLMFKKQSEVVELSMLKTNQINLINDLEIKVNESFVELTELAIKNSPSFLVRFNEVYPTFFQKLKEIQQDLTLHDLWFCAYLKLNYSSKDIASYTHVTIQAVQKKKNRLRKKLLLSSDEDIYQWINKI